MSSDHFTRISPPSDQKAQALHLLSPLPTLSSSTQGSGKMCGLKNTYNIPPVTAPAESIVVTVRESSLQGSDAPWWSLLLPVSLYLLRYQLIDKGIHFFRHTYFDSLWLLDLYIAVTGSLEDRITVVFSGHSERLSFIAKFVKVWLLFESLQQRANIEHFTSYDYFTQILDFASPALALSPVLTLSKRASERTIASLSLVPPGWYLTLPFLLFRCLELTF